MKTKKRKEPKKVLKACLTELKKVLIIQLFHRTIKGSSKNRADRYGIPYAYGSYLELAQSSEVDLVYIATPHPFHAQQSILMMNHGKHVICEKPMAINHYEVQQMMDCAKKNNVFLLEAMWTRFLPCVQEAVRMVKDGVIGEVKNVFGEFS